MSRTSTTFLRRVLLLDAVATGLSGILMAAGAGLIGPLTGLPEPLLRWAGIFLIVYAALVGLLARQDSPSPPAVRAVIGCNLAWAVGCVALLLFGSLDPTALGYAFVGAQALVVVIFAELQIMGLRRPTTIAV